MFLEKHSFTSYRMRSNFANVPQNYFKMLILPLIWNNTSEYACNTAMKISLSVLFFINELRNTDIYLFITLLYSVDLSLKPVIKTNWSNKTERILSMWEKYNFYFILHPILKLIAISLIFTIRSICSDHFYKVWVCWKPLTMKAHSRIP